MLMSKYYGYWFYHLPTDKIIQAKDLTEEYCMLNYPQEYEGPFENELNACRYKVTHPNAHEEYVKDLEEYWRFCNGECH